MMRVVVTTATMVTVVPHTPKAKHAFPGRQDRQRCRGV